MVCQSTRATYLLCEQENVVHQDEEALLLARVAPLLQQPSLEALAVRARIAQQLRGGGGLLADECLTNLHDPAEVCFKFFLLHLQSLRLQPLPLLLPPPLLHKPRRLDLLPRDPLELLLLGGAQGLGQPPLGQN